MESQASLQEASRLRLRFQMNNRLRLESLAALSKVFREHGEPLSDELLASLTFALPGELNGNGHGAGESGNGPAVTAAPDPGSPPPRTPPPGTPPPRTPPPGTPPPGTPPPGTPPPGTPPPRVGEPPPKK